MKSKVLIQIDNSIVRNENYKLDNVAFTTYTYLKFLEFIRYTEVFEINHRDLMKVIKIKDNRTLKKSLDILYQYDLLKLPINSLPIGNEPIQIKLHQTSDNNFTQLPFNILKRIDVIGYMGFRLLFYYESYINRKERKLFAYPSQITITNDLNCSYSTIKKYNDILVNLKLLKIDVHDFKFDGYDDLDSPLFNRYNNHYFVRLDEMLFVEVKTQF